MQTSEDVEQVGKIAERAVQQWVSDHAVDWVISQLNSMPMSQAGRCDLGRAFAKATLHVTQDPTALQWYQREFAEELEYRDDQTSQLRSVGNVVREDLIPAMVRNYSSEALIDLITGQARTIARLSEELTQTRAETMRDT